MKKQSLCLLSLTVLLITSCGKLDMQPADARADITSSSSTDAGVDGQNAALISSATTLRHTFSDGTTLTLYRLGDTFFIPGQDVGYASVKKLPEIITALEKQKGLQGQAVGMMPGALNGTSPLQWPSGVRKGEIYFDIGNFPTDLRNMIDSAITEWNATSVGIKLYSQRSGRNGTVLYPIDKYFTINGSGSGSIPEAVIKNLGCGKVSAFTSQIGYGDTYIDVAGSIYFNPECFTFFSQNLPSFKSAVIHEIGHIVGLYHQQAYCGRANYVDITTSPPPKFYDIPYQQNFGEACGSTLYGNLTTKYDFSSVMHYPYGSADYATTKVTMSPKANITQPYCGRLDMAGTYLSLSVGDINGINRMYSRGVQSTPC